MAFELIPNSFLRFPSLDLFEQEDGLLPSTTSISGLSVSEDEKNVYIEAAVPGIDPKNVEVTFSKGLLWIKAQKEEEEKTKKYYRKATNSFSYHLTVPGEIDPNKEPEAVVKNGLATITFAKLEETKPKKITVKG